jgi:Tol biopolymer transport system component
MDTSSEFVLGRGLFRGSPLVLLSLGLGGAFPAVAFPSPQGMTTRASVSSNGEGGLHPSMGVQGRSLSADGRFVAFQSASPLVQPDANEVLDVFVHDRQSGATELVSINSAGAAPLYGAYSPAISGDGLHVAFSSYAWDLVHGDRNDALDVFVRDREFGVMTRASVSSTGEEGDFHSFFPAISADGSQVAFGSYATNLVPGDGNGQHDLFVRDLAHSLTTRVSVASDGSEANGPSFGCSISAEGRSVAFHSFAGNLAPDDTNGAADVFVHERASGLTVRVSVASSGAQANGASSHASLSGDGRFVAFVSEASNLVSGDTNGVADVFIHDRQSGTTRRVSIGPAGAQADGTSALPAISADGTLVAFQSFASNLVPGDTNGAPDVFLHDLASGRTERLSLDSNGAQGNAGSALPSISADGRLASFQSAASNLVSGDANGVADVFVRDRECGASIYCAGTISSALCLPAIGFSGAPSASAGQGFLIEASGFPPDKPGFFAYGTIGPAAMPFLGGFLCAQMPLVRVPVANTGQPKPCGGSFALDFNAYVAAGADPTLVAGKTIWGQWWARDPGLVPPSNLSSSDAIRATLCP